MRALLMFVVAFMAILSVTASTQSSPGNGVQTQLNERQARWLNNSNSSIGNQIDSSLSSKPRLDMERRQVQEFLTAKNILKSIVKMLFGNQEEISATSRNVLGIIDKMLHLLKNTFGQRARSGSARTFRDSAEDAASAGVSIIQGYVKSVLANEDRCVQKHLCQASRDATRDSRDLGFIIASIGGYASSYLLDHSKSANFKSLYEASAKGRSSNEDCAKLYSECTE